TLTDEHVAAWRDNFDILIWYRDQLDQKVAEQRHAGAQSFQLFLDHIVAGLLEGLPESPGIDMTTGAVSAPEWRVDERRLREQLVMAHRCLVAKYQIYAEYEEFAPADVALLSSLYRMALLMGVQLQPTWFDEMNIDLT